MTAPVREVVGGLAPAGQAPPPGDPGTGAGGSPAPVVDALGAAVKPRLGELAGGLRPVAGRLDETVASLVAPLGPVVAPPSAPPDSGGGGAVTGEAPAVPVLTFGPAGGGAGRPGVGLPPAASAPPAMTPALVPDRPAPPGARPAAPAATPAGGPSAVAPASPFPGLPELAPAGPAAHPADGGTTSPAGVPARLLPLAPTVAGSRAGTGAGPAPAAPAPSAPTAPPDPAGLSGVAGGQGTALLFGIAALCGLVGLARPPDGLRRLPQAPAIPVPAALVPSLERPG